MNTHTIIIILNWNGWQDTIECLTSLTSLKCHNFSVVVVDNASTDSSYEKLLEWSSAVGNILNFGGVINEQDVINFNRRLDNLEWIYIQSEKNGGFAAGNNIGIRLALQSGCEFIWLLNNDTTVDPSSLLALEQRLLQDATIGMCGSVLCYYDDPKVVQVVGGVEFNFFTGRGKQLGQGLDVNDVQVNELAKMSPTYVAGASLFMPISFLHDIGLMEESYFLYFEEMDWAVRAMPKWKTAIASASLVYHKEGGSIGTSSRNRRSSLSQYYLTRNLIRFYFLRMPWLLPVALFRVLREMLNLALTQDYRLAWVTVKAFGSGLLMHSGKN